MIHYNIVMKLIEYLENVYGYDTPIFLKDVRIGRKSKTAIKEAFYRETKKGTITRESNGIYSLKRKDDEFPYSVSFEKIVEQRFICDAPASSPVKDFFRIGYYSGLTFLNQIGISQQVPAVLEITTNNTKSIKRYYYATGRTAILRKPKTKINYFNYQILQFLDMFSYVSLEEIKKNKELLIKYIRKNGFTKRDFTTYISFYKDNTLKKIVEGGLILAFM